MCNQVVLLEKSNIAQFAFRFTFGHIGGEIPLKQSGRSNSGHRIFVLYVCPKVVVLGESNIAPFTFRLRFCHAVRDKFEAV